jgi:uncharacterized protein (DUF1778 family)
MNEKTIVSLQMTMGEKAAILSAAGKEVRNMSNFLLAAALDRAKALHGIVPKYEEGEIQGE